MVEEIYFPDFPQEHRHPQTTISSSDCEFHSNGGSVELDLLGNFTCTHKFVCDES